MHQNIQFIRIKFCRLKNCASTSAALVPQFVGFSCIYDLITFDAASVVLSGNVVTQSTINKVVKLNDAGLNCYREIRLTSLETAFSTAFSR